VFARIIAAAAALLVGIALMPAIKDILDDLRVSMADLTGFSSLENAYWGMMPIFLLIFIFVGSLYYVIKGEKERPGRDQRER